jgi:hypothetical protein
MLIVAVMVLGAPLGRPVLKADAGASPLRVGYFEVAPHAMPDAQGRADGVAVLYFKRVAQEMALGDIEFVLLPLARLLSELEKSNLAMALLLAKNSERAGKFVYPEEPFCVTKPSIAISADVPLERVTAVEDLLTLTFLETPANFRSPIMQDPRLKIAPLSGDNFTRRCFAMIVAGRIEACYQPDHYPIQFEAARQEFRSKINVRYLPDPPIGLYSVFSPAAAPAYLRRYEAALATVKQRQSYGGEYEAFMAGYQAE